MGISASPKTKKQVQYIKNLSFDEDFKVQAAELLGYDATNNVLRRIKVDANGQVYTTGGSGGTPGGTDGQVQYNDGGAFGGASVVYWDDTNNRLGVGITSSLSSTLDVKNTGNDTPSVGSEIMTNGTFDTDLSGWTAGTNWAWSSGQAHHTSGYLSYLSQIVSVTSGTKYHIQIDVTQTAGSWIYLYVTGQTSGKQYVYKSIAGDATKTTKYAGFIPDTTEDVEVKIGAHTSVDCDIDNVSLKPITGTTDPIVRLQPSDSTSEMPIYTGWKGYNFLMGYGASNTMFGGSANIAFGKDAMHNAISGENNIAIGNSALYEQADAYDNIAIGTNALYSNITGYYNVAIGYEAGYSMIDGAQNFALGYHALYSQTGGSWNIAIGSSALGNLTTGQENIAIGDWAGTGITSETGSVSIGHSADAKAQSVAIGFVAKARGEYSVAIGSSIGAWGTGGGEYNVSIGYFTHAFLGGGSYNIGVGDHVGWNMKDANAARNSFVGSYNGVSCSGTDNVFLGYYAGAWVSGGSYNVAIGTNANLQNNNGNYNVCIGYEAGGYNSNHDASNNTFIGYRTGYSTTTGYNNDAMGLEALENLTTGTYNTAFGSSALGHITTGYVNIGFGGYAGNQANDGSFNTTSTYCTFIGYNTKPALDGDTNEIVIGYNAIGNGSNTTTIGNSSITKTILQGNVGSPAKTATLAAGATAIAATSNVMTITGDAGGNTVATITGGVSGQLLTLIFTDNNVTITDDNTHASNTIDLSASFTSADDTVLQLVYDGTSWYEVSRSTN